MFPRGTWPYRPSVSSPPMPAAAGMLKFVKKYANSVAQGGGCGKR